MAQVGPAAFLLLEQLLTQLHVAVDPEANVIVLARCYPHTDVEILKVGSKVPADFDKYLPYYRRHTCQT